MNSAGPRHGADRGGTRHRPQPPAEGPQSQCPSALLTSSRGSGSDSDEVPICGRRPWSTGRSCRCTGYRSPRRVVIEGPFSSVPCTGHLWPVDRRSLVSASTPPSIEIGALESGALAHRVPICSHGRPPAVHLRRGRPLALVMRPSLQPFAAWRRAAGAVAGLCSRQAQSSGIRTGLARCRRHRSRPARLQSGCVRPCLHS